MQLHMECQIGNSYQVSPLQIHQMEQEGHP